MLKIRNIPPFFPPSKCSFQKYWYSTGHIYRLFRFLEGDVSKKMLSKSIDILFLERFLNINNSLKLNNLYDARERKIINY